MTGLYDKDWNLIDIFDNDEDAMMYAVMNSVGVFHIKDL